ncbi:hypothetical protein ACN08N_17040 [Photobacterium leiognathi subsp. mandapamensis]|uniref:hypothetical protein n=1 Tax=Photobacterium leiognathi TaxID=553611 RepID=UPI003AF356FC
MELSNRSTSSTYTTNELNQLFSLLSDRMVIASKLIISAGLKASELHTLEKRKDGVYVVYSHDNKTSRRINVLPSLDAELSLYKRNKPVLQQLNRKQYVSHFNLPTGQHWLKRFNQMAMKVLGKCHSMKAIREQYAKNRWEYWYRTHTNEKTANALISLELGRSFNCSKYRQWRKENIDNTFLDYESAYKDAISEQTIGTLLNGIETNTCFSCTNLFFIANKKGISLSLEEILEQSSSIALEAVKNRQWQYDFAKYNFNMINADNLSTVKQKCIATKDLDIACHQLMTKIESTKEYLLEQQDTKTELNLPFNGSTNVRPFTYRATDWSTKNSDAS